ncbi:VAMP5 protein, partial [Dasyornis broadbenti]|nr:VAMP5 protein [Dasyornis broadbenti]
TRDPPDSGSPRADPDPHPRAFAAEGKDAAPGEWEVARAGLSASLRVPAPRVACVPRRVPWSRCPRVCPDPAVLVSPPSLRSPSPPTPQCPHPRCSHSISPMSPWCSHIVPPCPQAGLARCQREAEEVAELMRQNVARALEREGHLEQLQSRAQDLQQASEAFTRTTQTVTRRQRKRWRRWHLVALGLGLLLLFILGLALALALARSSPGTVSSTVPTPREGTKHSPSTVGTL